MHRVRDTPYDYADRANIPTRQHWMNDLAAETGIIATALHAPDQGRFARLFRLAHPRDLRPQERQDILHPVADMVSHHRPAMDEAQPIHAIQQIEERPPVAVDIGK